MTKEQERLYYDCSDYTGMRASTARYVANVEDSHDAIRMLRVAGKQGYITATEQEDLTLALRKQVWAAHEEK